MPPDTWYLLIHQLPARPLYFRARVRTQLARMGAAPLKKAVYALPKTAGALDGLTRLGEEIRAGGGEAFLCEARLLSEADNALLIAAARRERAGDYARVSRAAITLRRTALGRRPGAQRAAAVRTKLSRLRAQLERVRKIDFFKSPDSGATAAEAALVELHRALARRADAPPAASAGAQWIGRTWVTRKGLHVDRLACAWVVRRFIDPGARFRSDDPSGARAAPDELTFDVPGGDVTHEDGRCSVETLLVKAGVTDPVAKRIAEIVHDIDIKDGRFGHPEAAGIERLIMGIARPDVDDRARLERGLAFFDDLYRSFQKPSAAAGGGLGPVPSGRSPRRKSP